MHGAAGGIMRMGRIVCPRRGSTVSQLVSPRGSAPSEPRGELGSLLPLGTMCVVGPSLHLLAICSPVSPPPLPHKQGASWASEKKKQSVGLPLARFTDRSLDAPVLFTHSSHSATPLGVGRGKGESASTPDPNQASDHPSLWNAPPPRSAIPSRRQAEVAKRVAHEVIGLPVFQLFQSNLRQRRTDQSSQNGM